MRLDLVRSALGRLDGLDWTVAEKLLDDMTNEALEALGETGTVPEQVRWRIGADLRYTGQQNEVTVAFESDPRETRDSEMIRGVFESAYFSQYGVNPSHVPIEIVSWRLTAQGPENAVDGARAPSGSAAAPKGERLIPLWITAGPAKLYDRSLLTAGQQIAGPALIEERETTVVLPHGWSGLVDELGCITATREV